MVYRSEASKEQRRAYCRARKDKPGVREARAAKQREWREKNPGYQAQWQQDNRDKYLKSSRRAHGIVNPTGEEKSGPCEICGKPTQRLKFDHDHATGLFRGWLCHKCNVGLHYAENPEWLAAALAYLSSRRA